MEVENQINKDYLRFDGRLEKFPLWRSFKVIIYISTILSFFAILYSGLNSISNASDLSWFAIAMLIIGALLWFAQKIIIFFVEKIIVYIAYGKD